RPGPSVRAALLERLGHGHRRPGGLLGAPPPGREIGARRRHYTGALMPSMLGLVRRDADEIRELRPRTALGALVVVCALLVLTVRLYQLQILRGDEYSAQSVSNFRKSLFVPADRAMIKDRLGRILVDNRPSFDVLLTPAFCPPQAKGDARDKGGTRDEVMAKLATYLAMTPDDID